MYGQDQFSVIQPPIAGPIIGANTIPNPNNAIDCGRFSLGKLSIIIDCDNGKIAPPPIPCKNLDNTIIINKFEIPHKNEAKVKIIILNIKKFLRPINLHRKSTAGIMIPLAIR